MERLHRFPLQIDPISVVHQAVEDGVGQRPNKAPVKGGPKTDAKPARQAQEKLRERGGHGLRLPMVAHVKRQQALDSFLQRLEEGIDILIVAFVVGPGADPLRCHQLRAL